MPPTGTLSGPISFGKNFDKKVRKHIDQLRHRCDPPEAIAPTSAGGIVRVGEIIEERVARVAAGTQHSHANPPLLLETEVRLASSGPTANSGLFLGTKRAHLKS